ncbi:hypothetical protein [Saccharopolyspora phatthalungensis]|uniref:Uncharacterized protein n=1 Tax=Saccharopolyspora phatthalungensis TaxID=664693 RepID=A0A840Q0F3_9PSEU|nr:hypothetical protein [Saccharopolyspora phatthalungensis]MBB5152991.1 hypothetical protein [Saccharopolyspora phatthalungensis]
MIAITAGENEKGGPRRFEWVRDNIKNLAEGAAPILYQGQPPVFTRTLQTVGDLISGLA